MVSFLKNHPFAVEAFFTRSVVLTFAIEKEELEPLLPSCLQLDMLDGRYGFLAMAMVETKGLRPKGFPAFMGNSFFLVGYRIFVRYTNNRGKKMRGLYILKSETNKRKMELLGNFFTHYNYGTTDIVQRIAGNSLEISSLKSDFFVGLTTNDEMPPLPQGSPFADWKQARKFAGPMPFTFTYKRTTNEVLTIEGLRESWIPRPVSVTVCRCAFLDKLALKSAVLANAFIVENVPYSWKKGVVEKWKL